MNSPSPSRNVQPRSVRGGRQVSLARLLSKAWKVDGSVLWTGRFHNRYDTLGQVTSGKRFWSDGTPVAGQQFTYVEDSRGNRTAAANGGDASGQNLVPRPTHPTGSTNTRTGPCRPRWMCWGSPTRRRRSRSTGTRPTGTASTSTTPSRWPTTRHSIRRSRSFEGRYAAAYEYVQRQFSDYLDYWQAQYHSTWHER